MSSTEGVLFTGLEFNIVDGTETTEVGKITSFDGPSGSAAEIDMTHSKSVAVEVAMGLPDNGQITLGMNALPSDPGQSALEGFRTSQGQGSFTLKYAGLTTAQRAFSGFVLSNAQSGSSNGKVTQNTVIRVTGAIVDT